MVIPNYDEPPAGECPPEWLPNLTDEEWREQKLSLVVTFDPSEKCSCGCGVAAQETAVAINLADGIGPVTSACVFAAMAAALTRKVMDYSRSLPADQRAVFEAAYKNQVLKELYK